MKTTDAMLAKGRKDWWIYQFRGLARAGQKDVAGAGKEFDAALAALDPEKQFGAAATVVRTMAASSGKDAAMKRVEQLAPTNPRWPLVAAEICLDAKDAAGALAHLQPLEADADKLPPDARANLYRTLADSYHTLKPRPDIAKAIDAYTKYVDLAPTDVLALNNLAYLLAEEAAPPRPADAKTFSGRAYEIASKWAPGEQKGRVLDTHGWVLVLNGGPDLDAGIRVLEEVVSESRLLEAHYHLGEAHLRKKQAPTPRSS
jgi:tetratricopeptide (TPR) repeat protein